MHQSISSSRSSSTFRHNSRTRSSDPWTPSPPSSRVLSQLVSPNVSSHLVLHADTTSWQLCSLSRRATTPNSTACRPSTARIGASTHARSSCRRVKESRSASPSRSRYKNNQHPFFLIIFPLPFINAITKIMRPSFLFFALIVSSSPS